MHLAEDAKKVKKHVAKMERSGEVRDEMHACLLLVLLLKFVHRF